MRAIAYALLLGCAAPATRAPRTGAPLRCELRDYAIRSVEPLVEPDPRSKVGVVQMRGAALFVDARPNLTAEWLQYQLSRHVRAARTAAPSPDCPLDVDDPTIAVRSSGDGFIVHIRSDDDQTADEILRQARALAGAR